MSSRRPFDQALEILSDLVRINSVNPSLVPGGAGEKEIATFLAAFLKRQGIPAELQEVAPDRFNVVATVRGARPGPRVLLNGHLDTVSVEGMHCPFEPIQREGKIYARGAQDMKGGLAAAIAALLALARNQPDFSGEVVLAAVADEEDQSLGTQFFLNQWPKEKPFEFGLVLEPTDLKACTAHKGFAWLEVNAHGIAAHGSRPQDGVDAIRSMGAVLQELEALDERLQSRPSHPLLGSGSLHASIIQGGREWSSYPDRCHLKYERRTVPQESATTVEQELLAILAKLREGNLKFKAEARLVCLRPPFEMNRDHPILGRFYEVAGSKLPELVDWGAVSFWTDAALLSEAQIPTLVFGPRGGGLHSLEEYVVASDVISCAEIIYDFVLAGSEPSQTRRGSHLASS
ncbi:MAG: acetylornithine deacetylase [Acidobacteria bacterium]|nr:MAG: acetylornithine deacetylase [Acidobacteriota bacterium]